MSIETIKLSPKKNGNGYVSSYAVSISNKEVQECSLAGKRIIKIIDKDRAEIIIKAKQFTLTIEMLRKIAELKELEKEEDERIDRLYCANSNTMSMKEAISLFRDEQAGKIKRPAYQQLETYLLSLTMENIVDLTLMMYLGRDMDCNMNTNPGEERFLEFYDRYDDIVCGKEKKTLVHIVLEKTPLLMYLRTGYRLLNAPKGTSIDSFFHNWDEM